MKLRVVVASWVLGLGALVSAGCSGDDTLIKWSCDCGGDACAATEGDALAVSQETSCNTGSSFGPNQCKTTGDICACPNGDSKCEIRLTR